MWGGDEGWETVTISRNEEHYLKLYLLIIFGYIKPLINLAGLQMRRGPWMSV